jgi:hypothetical protein
VTMGIRSGSERQRVAHAGRRSRDVNHERGRAGVIRRGWVVRSRVPREGHRDEENPSSAAGGL